MIFYKNFQNSRWEVIKRISTLKIVKNNLRIFLIYFGKDMNIDINCKQGAPECISAIDWYTIPFVTNFRNSRVKNSIDASVLSGYSSTLIQKPIICFNCKTLVVTFVQHIIVQIWILTLSNEYTLKIITII